jgi:hypothetical protein
VEDVKQHRFPWAVGREHHDRPEVVLDPETTESVIALLARALVAVVRAVEESPDDR